MTDKDSRDGTEEIMPPVAAPVAALLASAEEPETAQQPQASVEDLPPVLPEAQHEPVPEPSPQSDQPDEMAEPQDLMPPGIAHAPEAALAAIVTLLPHPPLDPLTLRVPEAPIPPEPELPSLTSEPRQAPSLELEPTASPFQSSGPQTSGEQPPGPISPPVLAVPPGANSWTVPQPEAAPLQEAPASLRSRAAAMLGRGLRLAARAAAAYLLVVLVLIPLYRVVNPPASTLMLYRWLTLSPVERTWVPLENISPNLVRAVVVAEDGRFCTHRGIDLDAMRDAITNGGRGASTVSMQVTKNLFLWNTRSYVRKLIEIPLTLLSELVWPKWRILELYLNVAEWGPGVFGAEAAARHHFNKSAASLSQREAALLAAALPNPVVRDAGDPGPRTSSKARVVQARVNAYGDVASCVTDRYPAAAPAEPAPAFKAIRKRQPAPKRRERPAEAPFFNGL